MENNKRQLNDRELCETQAALVRMWGYETREVIEAIRLMQTRPDLSKEFVLKAYAPA